MNLSCPLRCHFLGFFQASDTCWWHNKMAQCQIFIAQTALVHHLLGKTGISYLYTWWLLPDTSGYSRKSRRNSSRKQILPKYKPQHTKEGGRRKGAMKNRIKIIKNATLMISPENFVGNIHIANKHLYTFFLRESTWIVTHTHHHEKIPMNLGIGTRTAIPMQFGDLLCSITQQNFPAVLLHRPSREKYNLRPDRKMTIIDDLRTRHPHANQELAERVSVLLGAPSRSTGSLPGLPCSNSAVQAAAKKFAYAPRPSSVARNLFVRTRRTLTMNIRVSLMKGLDAAGREAASANFINDAAIVVRSTFVGSGTARNYGLIEEFGKVVMVPCTAVTSTKHGTFSVR